MSEAEAAEQSESKPRIKPGKKLLFLLSINPTRASSKFKERVIATAHDTALLKKKPNEAQEG